MPLPTMSVINFVTGLSDSVVQDVIRAVNRQVLEDFAPVWGAAYSLRLHASQFDPAKDIGEITQERVRGESVMYLIDEATLPGVLGYHTRNTINVPVGFVFVTDLDDQDQWTTTLSHEVLELIIDPTVNVLVPGPDPRNEANTVLHTYEVCDAVERTGYRLGGVRVSNFITQSWFTPGDELGTRNDFLGVGVKSFDSIRDSHLAFYDLAANRWITYIGTQPPLAMATERHEADMYAELGKPRDDKAIQAAFDECRKKIGEKNLPHLKGITRLARYQARAVDWFHAEIGPEVKAAE